VNFVLPITTTNRLQFPITDDHPNPSTVQKYHRICTKYELHKRLLVVREIVVPFVFVASSPSVARNFMTD